jgi:hypothetical protein
MWGQSGFVQAQHHLVQFMPALRHSIVEAFPVPDLTIIRMRGAVDAAIFR